MTDFSSLQLKVNDLKAKVEQNSITPAYLGALLDDFISLIQDIDMTAMTPDIQASIVNASEALYRAGLSMSDSQKALSQASSARTLASDALSHADDAVSAATDTQKSFAALTKNIGRPNGLATLDSNGLVSSSQIPGGFDEVKEFYKIVTEASPIREDIAPSDGTGLIVYNESSKTFLCWTGSIYYTDWADGRFWGDDSEYGRMPIGNKIYLDTSENIQYRWSGSRLVTTGSHLALGETDRTAFPGSRGVGLETSYAELAGAVALNSQKLNKPTIALKQFSLVGKFISLDDGTERTQYNYSCTPFIPINRRHPIIVSAVADESVAVISWFDANKNYISGIKREGPGLQLYMITTEPNAPIVPAGAIYFRVSSVMQRYITPRPTDDELFYTNGPQEIQSPNLEVLAGAVADAFADAKKALFIDLWNIVSPTKYDGTTDTFPLNGITGIKYEEAVKIYAYSQLMSNYIGYNGSANTWACAYSIPHLRTNLPLSTRIVKNSDSSATTFQLAFYGNIHIDKFCINRNNSWRSSVNAVLYMVDCEELLTPLEILGHNANGFKDSIVDRLKEIDLQIHYSISFQNTPVLSFASLQKMVSQAQNTEVITITVHPITFSYLMGESEPAEEVGGTREQWTQLPLDGKAKNIIFATV